MGDASLVDLRDGHLFYTYDVRGVEYTASQDVTALGQVMPSGTVAGGGAHSGEVRSAQSRELNCARGGLERVSGSGSTTLTQREIAKHESTQHTRGIGDGARIGGRRFVTGRKLQKPVKTPATLLHVITVKWKAEATAEQKQAALDGVKKMAAQIPGIVNVWLKTVKVQPSDYNAVIAIEFRDEKALKLYAEHAAHAEWEKLYLPIRERSTTHDVSN